MGSRYLAEALKGLDRGIWGTERTHSLLRTSEFRVSCEGSRIGLRTQLSHDRLLEW